MQAVWPSGDLLATPQSRISIPFGIFQSETPRCELSPPRPAALRKNGEPPPNRCRGEKRTRGFRGHVVPGFFCSAFVSIPRTPSPSHRRYREATQMEPSSSFTAVTRRSFTPCSFQAGFLEKLSTVSTCHRDNPSDRRPGEPPQSGPASPQSSPNIAAQCSLASSESLGLRNRSVALSLKGSASCRYPSKVA